MTEALRPFPVSARVQRDAFAMARVGRVAERLAEPRLRPFKAAIDVRVRDLARVDPDPDALLRLKAGRPPRAVERPDDLDEQLACATPQFFLRNTQRGERSADPEWLERSYVVVRDTTWQAALAAARRGGFREPRAPELASTRLAMLMAERRVVMLEARWHELHGRPDPIEIA